MSGKSAGKRRRPGRLSSAARQASKHASARAKLPFARGRKRKSLVRRVKAKADRMSDLASAVGTVVGLAATAVEVTSALRGSGDEGAAGKASEAAREERRGASGEGRRRPRESTKQGGKEGLRRVS